MNIHHLTDWLRLRRLRAFWRYRKASRAWHEPEPALRAELFSAEQMERHGKALAARHRLSPLHGANLLLERLAGNESVLVDASEQLTPAASGAHRVTPAAEWLLDNFYLIEEQIRLARRHLPKGYSRELPRLSHGPSAGLPRVYDLAQEAIAHGDGRLDVTSLRRFVAAYQSVAPLALGELWAIPIMLRLALIENLRRVAARVVVDWRERGLAVRWADTLIAAAEHDPTGVILAVADMARAHPPLSGAFVAELSRRLQGQGPALALPLSWLEQQLAEGGRDVERTVRREAQQQAANQVSIGNSIGSLRALSAVDWRGFVESVSLVEETLCEDPAGIYAAMDFATRDDYRHAVERMARRHHLDERAVAQAALDLARAATGENVPPIERHVGWWLVARGRARLRRALGLRGAGRGRSRRTPVTLYLGGVALLTLASGWAILALARGDVHGGYWLLLGWPVLAVAGDLALNVLNWLVTLTVSPRHLPRMDYTAGVPLAASTLVVVPCLISDADEVAALTDALEVRFFGNRDDHLYFALLTDFTDAAIEHVAGDDALLALARQRIGALNARHAEGAADRFYLFHRPRQWNPRERCWMGRERKRGKLADLNALLRGHGADRFMAIEGDIAALPPIRYVITLDADTQLPRDAAVQLVGTLDHPLNRPRHDRAGHRARGGHGLLQPRVGISMSATARSRYARLYGSDAGIDPYTRMTSDVYQDLFGEGSFIGKGIYDVDAFERALAGRFPDNRILSHDLIEGCHARAALVSDVQLYEEYPARYQDDVRRRHRWIRGDWQLLPWLMPWAPTRGGHWRRNTLNAISRWKILDNLRRSLVAPALLALLVAGWLVVGPLLAWTLAVLATVVLPAVVAALVDVVRKPRDARWDQHVRTAAAGTLQRLARLALRLAWLPHEAQYTLDAIVRTLWRTWFSRRHLLEWRSSAEVTRASRHTVAAVVRQLWVAPAVAVLVAAALAMWRPLALLVAAPLLVAWLAAPALAWWVGMPRRAAMASPSASQRAFLRLLARRTWAFFDSEVNAENHWLPPDNVQEQPVAAVAQRTSPTNIGLALLANLSAHDFGWLTADGLLARTSATLATVAVLPRHRGHLYNWYDTRSLKVLPPLYVSTVDSGNFVGHLLVLRAGLQELADQPVFALSVLRGLRDGWQLVHDSLPKDSVAPVEDALRELGAALAAPPATASAALAVLERQRAHALALVTPGDDEAAYWVDALQAQCQACCASLRLLGLDPAASGTGFAGVPTLRELAAIDPSAWPAGAQDARREAQRLLALAQQLVAQCTELATVDWPFLYDAARDLLAIGYNVDERRRDAGNYDLLASEARLTSLVAIAQGQLPKDNWFALGRLLASNEGEPVLLSWTGSMFEYLMPALVLPDYEGSLLHQSNRAAVARQIDYGRRHGVPWGVSESGYNAFDVNLNYQYRAFGVPGLGLKRGLGDDLVIAPYASMLATMVAPVPAARNLAQLVALGMLGRYGMYEALDCTPARLPRGEQHVVVQSFMAHHQGMALAALANTLLGRRLPRRFAANPELRAISLLLQERVPHTAAEYLHATDLPELAEVTRAPASRLRVFTDPNRPRPAVQLLSNGHYHVMVTSAGGGSSRCRDEMVTRWRADATRDAWGMFGYLRDVASDAAWSLAYQPMCRKTDLCEAIFSDARAEFRVRERDWDAHTEIVVSPEDDIELRRTRLTNRGRKRRLIELTSYAEVVLAPAAADAAHPAFSKLFVQTELVPALQAILAHRRARSAGEATPWLCHLLAVHGADVAAISYETDRARFIGRDRDLARPAALTQEALSGTAGAVLDPIVAIRCRVALDPGQSATLDLVTGIADDRAGCLRLIGKYRDQRLADRVFDLAWTHSQVALRQLNVSLAQAQLFERMAAAVIFPGSPLRAEPAVLVANRRGQSGLWGEGVSGDLPIVLLSISDATHVELVQQLLQAHAYWRLRGLAVDLVIWNEDRSGYRQDLRDAILGLVTSGTEAALLDHPGGVFVRAAQSLSGEDRLVMQAAACIVLSDQRGSLGEQVERRRIEPRAVPPVPAWEHARAEATGLALPPPALPPAPLGRFTAEGHEYEIVLDPGRPTPAPWVNVLANQDFGSVVSATGSAYSWRENAHEFRLTPWHNDPVADSSGEALYLRDAETGRAWSPMPWPRRGAGRYVTRHGFGYSVFEHVEDGIASEVWVCVAVDAPVKLSVIKLRNHAGRERRLSLLAYMEWVLGDLRDKTMPHIVTEQDAASGVLLACNAFNSEFAGRVGFLATDALLAGITGDRGEFIGRNRSLQAPAALERAGLSGRLGAGLDPCAALVSDITLAAGEEHTVVVCLGAGRDNADALALAQRFANAPAAADALDQVHAQWRQRLGVVQVRTPEPALDVLANGWLVYQTLACRFWARSGFYQSGGAFGFRDQLQDSMALLYAAPDLSRAQLLRCAAHQFKEGDVQHWWHPPQDRGVRTRCSDDYLWLPFAVARYVLASGDRAVLDEPVGYLDGRLLHDDEESYYDLPQHAALVEPLYQHCVRAIERGLAARGPHGLPLMGSGDWNDGMNRVGEHGRGESIWLGWFECTVLADFARVARAHAAPEFAQRCTDAAGALRTALERDGWDGRWYRRAYFDDGTPLGSAGNAECRIDAIAQSWSVLSGAAEPARQRAALDALDAHLVRRDPGLIQLLDPPFDSAPLDPGYIKGYLPGVRENGGQYTHAAVWAAMAFARLGDAERAWELARMIAPTRHGIDAAHIERYKVEPYVVSADVYARAPHVGRGGWSWYTGSAGWLYRLLVESLLGLRLDGGRLHIEPLLPADWPGFALDYRAGATVWHITVRQLGADGAAGVTVDGAPQADGAITLTDDGAEHHVQVNVVRAAPAAGI